MDLKGADIGLGSQSRSSSGDGGPNSGLREGAEEDGSVATPEVHTVASRSDREGD